jgi:DNA-binding NarL/FixJ family response regulator
VSAHMSNAMRKLDVDSRTKAVAVAHRAGLLPD